MERELNDEKTLSHDEVNEMEERRLTKLNEAGVDEDQVLQQANKHLNTWNSYFQENITRGKDDVNFCIRDQWTAVERSEFTRLFKPCMVFNKLYDNVKKIAGEQRKNKPDLLVRSLTGRATQEQINLRADLVRTIAYQSQNDLVYQTAFKSALMMGYGAFQVVLDYESPRSFRQIPRYDLISDPTRCSWDPTALKPHKGDGNFCSRSFLFTRDEFFATYPYVTNPVSYVDPYMLLDFQWQTRDTIVVQDYFVKEWFPLIIYKLSDGTTVTDDEWRGMQKQFAKRKELAKDSMVVGGIIMNEIPKIVSERQTQDYEIMHYRLIRDQIIDFSKWPSKQLPIPFVDGDSYYVEGRQYTKSFIHEARDAQKLLNYSRSELAAELKNRRREQWIGTPDNIKGYEQDWRNPELQVAMLRAQPDPKTGAMPMKQPAWEISQGLFMTGQTVTEDIHEILGFSENEALQGKDVSGKARRERKMEGSMSAYVFFDNLNQSIEQGGRVVNDLLDYCIGKEERQMTINKKDGKSESIIINEVLSDGKIKNELELGDFDVEIDTGPSFAVQRDVALEFFQQTIAAAQDPQVFNLIADLWAKNLDIQFMPQIVERLQNLVPPDILAKEQGEKAPPPKPNPQQQMQQQMMQQQMQMQQAEMQNKMALVQIKQQELQLKKEQNQIDQLELQLKAQESQMKAQLDIYNHNANIKESEITHDLGRQKIENDHAHKMASLLTDIHSVTKQHEHEKEINRQNALAKSND